MSPDPGNAGADLGNPQSWNGYAYVGNNPVNVTDPDGLGFFGDLWSVVETAVGLYNPAGVQLTNTEPWNELPPISGVASGGMLSTGDVFGGGNTGPFIFSWDRQSTIGPLQLPYAHGPLDTFFGWGRRSIFDAIDLMSGGNPTPTAQGLMWWLRPDTQAEQNGWNANGLYYAFALSRKPGKLGTFKGTDALRRENEMARAIINELNLSGKNADAVHGLISDYSIDQGRKAGFPELLKYVKDVLGLP